MIPEAEGFMTPFEQIDHALTLFVNEPAGRSKVVDRLVFDVADTKLLSGGVFLVPYWWLWFKADENGVHVQRRNVVVAILAIGVLAGIVWLLKALLPFQPAPLNASSFGLRLPFGIDPAGLNDGNSFPSGHAALFFALSVPLWMYSRWLGATAAVWALSMICLPLVYLGYHWPSDIAAGALAGIALMLLLCRLIGATRLPNRVVSFSAKRAPAFYAIAWLIVFETAVLFEDLKALSVSTARAIGVTVTAFQ